MTYDAPTTAARSNPTAIALAGSRRVPALVGCRVSGGAAGPVRVPAVVPGAAAPLDAGRGAVPERAGRPTANSDGAHLAGRYALHEFAKNVFDVAITNGKGQPITATRPSASVGHRRPRRHRRLHLQSVRRSHRRHLPRHRRRACAHQHSRRGHLCARRFERPARVTFVQPPGKQWRVATQLFPTADPLVFTAPNIHYLMDSPTDFSNFTLREFTVDDGSARTAADLPDLPSA